jgi:hypothetical protein
MRCPDCNKFTGLENGEPEISTEDLNSGSVNLEIRLTRNCADCSTELKEYTFSIDNEHEKELNAHLADKHEGVTDLDASFELVMDDFSADESGGGRYKKNMISIAGGYTVKCTLCNAEVVKQEVKDEAPAGAFDEM